MKKLPSQRNTYWLGFILILAFLAFAIYLEMFQGVTPCPLCILQRICLCGLAIVFFMGAIIKLRKLGSVIVGSMGFLISIAGLLLSGRQAWLQHNASGLTSNCDVSFQYMVQVMPLSEVLKKIFLGGTECSQINWEFLHLSLAEWSFIWFLIFSIVSIWQICRKHK